MILGSRSINPPHHLLGSRHGQPPTPSSPLHPLTSCEQTPISLNSTSILGLGLCRVRKGGRRKKKWGGGGFSRMYLRIYRYRERVYVNPRLRFHFFFIGCAGDLEKREKPKCCSFFSSSNPQSGSYIITLTGSRQLAGPSNQLEILEIQPIKTWSIHSFVRSSAFLRIDLSPQPPPPSSLLRSMIFRPLGHRVNE